MTAMAATSRLMVLMFTDIVGSVELKGRLGAAVYTDMIARHDRLFRECMGKRAGARIVQDTGDGFLASFETASDAVIAALQFHEGLRQIEWSDVPLSVRIGLNLGQVSEVRDGAGGVKYVGLATDMAARVMSLAQGGQILMTRSIFDDARQFVREHPQRGAAEPPALQWMAHGQYLFKGSDEPIEVYEVGAAGFAPLRAPPDSDKARRAVNAMEEETLGWRPAAGLEVPRRRGWVLTQKLGEGGFGEVWLGKHNRTKESRVFKFCFDAERLRSFKRELTLFRLLRDGLGDRKDIAQLHEVQFEEPPYFLESEYSGYGSLSEWAEKQGGLSTVPLDLRIDMVARTADAVAAAHSLGVMHKDIKPSNILMYMSEDGVPRPRLADFGIGVVTDRSQLEKRNITITGMTEGWLEGNESSRTGTRMYAPPESLVGKQFTIQGDIYALGVFLYQMAVGDFNRPLATGWESSVLDVLLREDIQACTMGEPEKRLGSAKELANRLRALPERRRALRAAKRRKMMVVTAGAAAVVAVVGAVWGFQQYELRERAERAEAEAVRQRDKAFALADNQMMTALKFITSFDMQLKALEGASAARRLSMESGAEFLKELGKLDPENDELQGEVAKAYARLGDVQGGLSSANAADKQLALRSYETAAAISEQLVTKAPTDALKVYSLAAIQFKMADLTNNLGDSAAAKARYEKAIGLAERSMKLEWPKLKELPEDPSQLGARLIAAIELKLSDVYRANGDVAQARVFLDRSIAHRIEQAKAAPGDEQALRDLAIGLGRKGKVLEAEKDYSGSLAAWEESVRVREQVYALPGSEESMRRKRDLAQGRTELGAAYRNAGKIDEACEQSLLSLAAIRELIASDPKDQRLKLTLLDSCTSATGTLRTAGRLKEGLAINTEHIAAAREYLDANPTDQTALYSLVQALHKCGEFNIELGDKAAARSAFEQELAVIETVKRRDPADRRTDRWQKSAIRELAELDGKTPTTDGGSDDKDAAIKGDESSAASESASQTGSLPQSLPKPAGPEN